MATNETSASSYLLCRNVLGMRRVRGIGSVYAYVPDPDPTAVLDHWKSHGRRLGVWNRQWIVDTRQG